MLATESAAESIAHVDARVATALNEHASDTVTTVLGTATELGGSAVLLPLTILAVCFLAARRRWSEGLLIVYTIVGAELLTLALKLAFRRERPSLPDPLASAPGFSFPSGHALISLSFYGALAFVIASSVSSRRARLGCFAVAGLLALAIGFSRVYLGVHYLSDVLAGFILGAAWLVVCVALWHRVTAGAEQAALHEQLEPDLGARLPAVVVGQRGDDPAVREPEAGVRERVRIRREHLRLSPPTYVS